MRYCGETDSSGIYSHIMEPVGNIGMEFVIVDACGKLMDGKTCVVSRKYQLGELFTPTRDGRDDIIRRSFQMCDK